MDRLRPYPEHRDSGLPWLGDVPAHWDVRRTKYFLREVDERSATGEEELLSVSHKTGITPRRQKNVTMFTAESNVGHKLCRQGDVAVNTMWAWMAALGVSRYDGLVSPSYGVYRPHRPGEFLPEYLDELLRTPTYRSEYLVRSTGITSSRLRLYPEHFLRIPLIHPPPAEQAAIVRFLDHVDRRIRRSIRAKQKLITLLEELKAAIIHRAVTRGLDPNVRLRPSGVEWLGDVPEHWEVRRLKWVTRLQRGYDLPADRRLPGPFPVVSSGGIIDTHSEPRCDGPGVAMGRYGSTDSVFFIERDFWPHNTALFVTDFQGNLPKWCYYLLRSIAKAEHSGKSAVPGVDRKDLFEIVVAVPPSDEQSRMVDVIDAESRHLDRVVSTIQREISLLRELRTRLIADVVTGKLDVREVAARLPVEPDDDEPLDEASNDDGGEHGLEDDEVVA